MRYAIPAPIPGAGGLGAAWGVLVTCALKPRRLCDAQELVARFSLREYRPHFMYFLLLRPLAAEPCRRPVPARAHPQRASSALPRCVIGAWIHHQPPAPVCGAIRAACRPARRASSKGSAAPQALRIAAGPPLPLPGTRSASRRRWGDSGTQVVRTRR